MYAKMPFGLMNVGATFQRVMDISFAEEKERFVVVYLDDIVVYSESNLQQIDHLRKTFLRSRKFRISLNPKKSHFIMLEGKLLGHIISKDGIKSDPRGVQAIQNIGFPRSKKEV